MGGCAQGRTSHCVSPVSALTCALGQLGSPEPPWCRLQKPSAPSAVRGHCSIQPSGPWLLVQGQLLHRQAAASAAAQCLPQPLPDRRLSGCRAPGRPGRQGRPPAGSGYPPRPTGTAQCPARRAPAPSAVGRAQGCPARAAGAGLPSAHCRCRCAALSSTLTRLQPWLCRPCTSAWPAPACVGAAGPLWLKARLPEGLQLAVKMPKMMASWMSGDVLGRRTALGL